MLIPRYYKRLNDVLSGGKVTIIYGPRRVGKTTLVKMLLKDTKLKYKVDSGDNIRIRNILNSEDFQLIREYASGYELIVIDEAQNIPGIGTGLKIMIDLMPDLQIIATGSSSFNLEQEVGEPLTGRKKVIVLYPLSHLEFKEFHNDFELKQNLRQFMIFGTYPEVYTAKSDKQRIELLRELVDSYLLKDVLGLDRLRSPKQLVDLLKLLAFQTGQEVSFHELATNTGLNVRTVERYLYLLEKGFVIYKLSALSRNPRNEITKKSKYYFYDNGIRNGIIIHFNELDMRNDVGQLWENFLVSERLKYLSYRKQFVNRYFWRSYQQGEIDYLEQRNNELLAFEFKWGRKQAKLPREFSRHYNIKAFNIVNQDNYLEFIL